MTQFVFDFAEGYKDTKDLLRGKAQALAEDDEAFHAGATGIHLPN